MAKKPKPKPSPKTKAREKVSAPTGRRSTYTPELGAAICAHIAGGKSLRWIARQVGMPAASTVVSWSVTPGHPFVAPYRLARDAAAWVMVDDLIDIADDSSKDWTVNADGEAVINHEVLARAKLRIDTRKWIASKILPKDFGDRLLAEHTGKDGAPIQMEDVSKLELARWIAHQFTTTAVRPLAAHGGAHG